MFEFNVSRELDFTIPQTDRAAELIRLFGLRQTRMRQRRLRHACRITVAAGDIVMITGPSGCGKSVLMEAMYNQLPAEQRLRLDEIDLPEDVPVIDCFDGSVFAATEALCKAAMSEVFDMLQAPAKLSTGQQQRFRMAKALAAPQRFIFADEFTASLDRIAALAIAWHLRRLSPQSGKVFVLATAHRDILAELRPDILIVKSLNGTMQTLYRDDTRGKTFSRDTTTAKRSLTVPPVELVLGHNAPTSCA